MRNIRRSYKWLCVWACCLAILSGTVCHAQKDGPTASDLLKQAGTFLDAKKYDDAVGPLSEYLALVRPSTAQGVIRVAQDKRFRLITILIEKTKEPRLDEAVVHLQDYIDMPLAEHPRLARSLMATCFYEIGEFERCVEACINAIRYNEDPASRAGAREWTPDEREKFAKFIPIEFENEFTPEQITSLHMTMAESYYELGRWEDCIEPYTFVAEHTPDSQVKGYAIMQMINAMISMPDFDRIAAWIPKLYRTEARYDIRVNLALMDVAAALFDAGRFDDALPLYRMILPREELLAYQREQLRKLRIEHEMAPEEGMEVSEGEALLFGIVDETRANDDEEESPEEEHKPAAIVELEDLIKTVEALPAYENDIKYRMAQIYEEVGRFWEAVRFYYVVYQADPDSQMGRFCIFQIIDILLNRGEVAEAEKIGFAYLESTTKGITPRRVAYRFTKYYHQNDDMADIKKVRPYIDAFYRADDDDNVRSDPSLYGQVMQYDAELYFMQAVADLVEFQFVESEKGFKLVLDEFPGSHQDSNSHYWYGMSKLFIQKFGEAFEVFEEYPTLFPNGDWVDEVAYQGGVCLFGLEDYDAASNRFSFVINTYPDPEKKPAGYSSTFPEACNMRGDIYGSRGEHARAVADYRMAIKHATKPAQSSYAVFALAKLYNVSKQNAEAIVVVEEYLEQWKAKADISKALYWIGKCKLQMAVENQDLAEELIDEVVADYLAAITEYGTDVQQDGVDMMIEELVRIAGMWLKFEREEVLLANLDAAIESTEDKVLRLRLRVAKAMLTNTENELGLRLLSELDDFKSVPPPVLATICKVSIAEKDYSRAEELLDIFRNDFEDSDFVRVAFKLRALGQFADDDLEGTLATIEETQGRFTVEPDMAWAQLLKAQILLKHGKLQEAIDANMMVVGIPAWRGEPLAQATYQLGQTEEQRALAAKGDERDQLLARAFSYYQRVYFQYKGYAKGYWAAESYLASARCLKLLGQDEDRLNTYSAMLFDRFVNTLPQADIARKELGAAKVAEIEALLDAGTATNITIAVETVAPAAETNSADAVENDAPATIAAGGDE